jgi:hypothetical protein
MKFDLTRFVMNTLQSMRDNGEDEYKIRQYALKYYERNVLTEENLAIIEDWFVQDKDNESDAIDEEITDIIN